jgi:hypothetical protein
VITTDTRAHSAANTFCPEKLKEAAIMREIVSFAGIT